LHSVVSQTASSLVAADATSAVAFQDVLARVLAIVAIGGSGVYLMLPRGAKNRGQRWLGGGLATLALILFATNWISPFVLLEGGLKLPATLLWPLDKEIDNVTCWTFHLLAALSLASAVMMITSRNPVYSALWFAMVLLSNSGLFLLQRAEFLAVATIIIYAGAIIVTFLFVIMLAQPQGTAGYDRASREPLLASLAGIALSTALVGAIHFASKVESTPGGSAAANQGRGTAVPTTAMVKNRLGHAEPKTERWSLAPDNAPRPPHVDGLGRTLFLDHFLSVEVVGILLLVAVVGAMLITSHRSEVTTQSS
jgi:NADH-quinone oxidoreductase subunit J